MCQPSIVLQESGVARGTGGLGMTQAFVLIHGSLNKKIKQEVIDTASQTSGISLWASQ